VETPEDVENLEVKNPQRLSYVTQTTLSVDDTEKVIDALRDKFANIVGPKKDDICYATQNRQDAVKDLAKTCDVVLVVGSVNSSNSNRLRELAEKQGVPGYLIDGPEDLENDWFNEDSVIGITAGASAPEILVKQVIDKLKSWGATQTDELITRRENISFSLPVELRKTA